MVCIVQKKNNNRQKDSPSFNNTNYISFQDDKNVEIGSGFKLRNSLFNLNIESNIECILKELKQFTRLCFTFEYYSENKKIVQLLLNHNYNKPEIKSSNPDYVCLKYLPRLKCIKTEFIDYMIREYSKGEQEPCEALVTFNKEDFTNIHNSILGTSSNEISGKLNICEQTIYTKGNKQMPVFVVCVKDKGVGSDRDCDMVESRYNFHTHPTNAYKIYNCELGWPSCDDYIIFATSTAEKKIPTLFHLVCTVEGIYALTVPKQSIQHLQDFKDLFNDIVDIETIFTEYIKKNLNVSKKDFNTKDGVYVGDFCIKTVKDYIRFINDIIKPFCYSCDDKEFSFRLVEIKFFDWNNNRNLGILDNNIILFNYFFPKIKGNCFLIEEHVN